MLIILPVFPASHEILYGEGNALKCVALAVRNSHFYQVVTAATYNREASMSRIGSHLPPRARRSRRAFSFLRVRNSGLREPGCLWVNSSQNRTGGVKNKKVIEAGKETEGCWPFTSFVLVLGRQN